MKTVVLSFLLLTVGNLAFGQGCPNGVCPPANSNAIVDGELIEFRGGIAMLGNDGYSPSLRQSLWYGKNDSRYYCSLNYEVPAQTSAGAILGERFKFEWDGETFHLLDPNTNEIRGTGSCHFDGITGYLSVSPESWLGHPLTEGILDDVMSGKVVR